MVILLPLCKLCIYEGYQHFLNVFNDIIAHPKYWSGDSVPKAIGLKRHLESFQFVFFLGCYRNVFAETDVLHR